VREVRASFLGVEADACTVSTNSFGPVIVICAVIFVFSICTRRGRTRFTATVLSSNSSDPKHGWLVTGPDTNFENAWLAAALSAEYQAKPGEFRRGVLFAFWSGEELGLIGSSHFVAHPVTPLSNVIAYVNFDMVGPSSRVANAPPRANPVQGGSKEYVVTLIAPLNLDIIRALGRSQQIQQKAARKLRDPHRTNRAWAAMPSIASPLPRPGRGPRAAACRSIAIWVETTRAACPCPCST
jgi:hypothetical protein